MWKKLPLKGFIYSSLGLSLASAVLILITLKNLPPVVPLFYGLPSGADQLVPTLMLFIVPGFGLFITAVNILLAQILKDPFFKKTLVVSTTFISFLGAITIVKIISLVGFF